jgi:Ricin-type beta-trefoil lectin domain/Domain of unknown function (DUF5122) beta-propeller
MHRIHVGRDLAIGSVACILAVLGVASPGSAAPGIAPPATAARVLVTAVSQVPVAWTPNVSATTKVGATSCNSTFFGSAAPCVSEVYGSAFVNGEVVEVGAFTEVCQPAKLSQGLCAAGTQVTRNDIFAYQPKTGLIDKNFVPVLNQGPAWTVIPGPTGSHTVYVGGAFTSVNGTTHKGLVQLNVNPGVTTGSTADGSVVSGFKGNVSNFVRDLALSPDGKALYAGGQFTSVNSVAESGLVRLNAATGAVDSSFHFTLSGPVTGLPTKVEAMSLSPDGKLLAFSGTALQVNGVSRPRLAIVATGGTLGAVAALTDFTAPILTNNCSGEHDYVRAIDFSPDGSFLVAADTGFLNDGSMPFSLCDAIGRFNTGPASTTTTGTPVDVAPSWINYTGGDSFYSVAVAGDVVYAGGHNRWINNYCGVDNLCAPNTQLTDGLSGIDANTGLGLDWWHPQTGRGAGTMYLHTFGPGTYDGTSTGLVVGTDVDLIGANYHSENALFPEASTTSAAAGGPIPAGLFSEEGGTNTGAPMCLDDPGDSATSTAAELAICINAGEQTWSVPAKGTTGSIKVNGLCLATAGGGTSNGTAVQLSTCNSGSNTQQWSQGAANTVINKGAALCLDDPGSSTTPGTQLDIATCSGGLNQVWPLPVAQGPPSGAPKGPIFSYLKQADTNVPCLDLTGGSTATGTKVELWTCNGNSRQSWTVEPGRTIQINGNFCVDSANGATAPGTLVVLDPCNGSSSQVWAAGPNFTLVQAASGLCLVDPASNAANGVQLQISNCGAGLSQQWQLPGW